MQFRLRSVLPRGKAALNEEKSTTEAQRHRENTEKPESRYSFFSVHSLCPCASVSSPQYQLRCAWDHCDERKPHPHNDVQSRHHSRMEACVPCSVPSRPTPCSASPATSCAPICSSAITAAAALRRRCWPSSSPPVP